MAIGEGEEEVGANSAFATSMLLVDRFYAGSCFIQHYDLCYCMSWS